MATPRRYIKRANINYNPSSQAFNELSKAAGKIVPKATNIARNAGQLALPIAGPKKIVAGAKIVKKVVKAVTGKKKTTKTSRGSSLPIPGMGVKSKAERIRVTNSKFDERIANIEKNLKQAITEGKSSFQIKKFRDKNVGVVYGNLWLQRDLSKKKRKQKRQFNYFCLNEFREQKCHSNLI